MATICQNRAIKCLPFTALPPTVPTMILIDVFRRIKDPIICPNCYRVITANNPMVSNKRCHECMTPNGVQRLAGEIFLFDKGDFITNIFRFLFGG